jgi:hypothetical protein
MMGSNRRTDQASKPRDITFYPLQPIPLSAYLSASVLSLLTFISRYLTRGPVYMVDGPSLVAAIAAKTYVIQPPGYWLFAHLGGMFHDPASGLAFWNRFFSAIGVGVIFLICRKLARPNLVCWFGALAYSSVFFAWFAGDTHSSYPSQMLFPALFLYCALLYMERPSIFRLIAWAAVFSVGAGLRPSDGAFMVPLYLYFLFQWVSSNRDRALFVLTTAFFCLLWYLPTHAALNASNGFTFNVALGRAFRERSLLLCGVTPGSVLNMVRVLLPMCFAFWMFLPSIFMDGRKNLKTVLILWILPGLSFLLFVYMADADYLTFCTGSLILAVALRENVRLAVSMLLVCFVWNTGLFLSFSPLSGDGNVGQLVNFYVVKYCHYGIIHHWTSTLGAHGIVPH